MWQSVDNRTSQWINSDRWALSIEFTDFYNEKRMYFLLLILNCVESWKWDQIQHNKIDSHIPKSMGKKWWRYLNCFIFVRFLVGGGVNISLNSCRISTLYLQLKGVNNTKGFHVIWCLCSCVWKLSNGSTIIVEHFVSFYGRYAQTYHVCLFKQKQKVHPNGSILINGP